MRVLFDTDVILDVVLDRPPFAEVCTLLFGHVEEGRVQGTICATALTTVFYLGRKAVGTPRARREVAKLLSLFDIASVNRPVLQGAVALPFSDFEDAVTHEAARLDGAEGIVTRNVQHYKKARLRIYAPADLLQMLTAADAG